MFLAAMDSDSNFLSSGKRAGKDRPSPSGNATVLTLMMLKEVPSCSSSRPKAGKWFCFVLILFKVS